MIAAVAVFSGGRVLAQQASPDAGAAHADSVDVGDYQVGPGDQLSVAVSGVRDFNQSIRVSNSGRIRVPYVGVMFAAGMTTVQLEREIAALIRDHELVNEPMVRVEVTQYRARPVHILGSVPTPGQFVLTGDMYLLDLISRGGGLSNTADSTAILYRRRIVRPQVSARITAEPPPNSEESPSMNASLPTEATKDAEVIPINLDALTEGLRPDLNIRLQGGDVLYVPRRLGQNIYIIGDVKVPGAYQLPRRGEVTAAQAVIYAGGPLLTAKTKAGFLMRHDENGERQAIPVNFAAIIDGKQPDLTVQADDIIYIPSSGVKVMTLGLLNQIPRLIQQFVIF